NARLEHLVVGVDDLLGREGVAKVGLGLAVLGPGAGTQEGRDRDGDQDGDDQYDDHELDEGEALFLALVAPLNQLLKHGGWGLLVMAMDGRARVPAPWAPPAITTGEVLQAARLAFPSPLTRVGPVALRPRLPTGL